MEVNQQNTYRANGKLLITGEYLVLKGAKALAVPLKSGQTLEVSHGQEGLKWIAQGVNGIWLDAQFDTNMKLLSTNDSQLGESLESVLQQALSLNSSAKERLNFKEITTNLEFNRDWGWGSSSTLITLVSQLTGANPYRLLEKTFGGSGYDIACASSSSPILYRIKNDGRNVHPLSFSPKFNDQIFFVYSGNKQNSQKEVVRFNKEIQLEKNIINTVNTITEDLILANNIESFGELMEEHEKIVGHLIGQETIKQKHFNDFEGYTKSLGAWGGDFFMAATPHDTDYVTQYFGNKGLNTIFSFKDIVLNA